MKTIDPTHRWMRCGKKMYMCECYFDCNNVTTIIHIIRSARHPTVITNASVLKKATISHAATMYDHYTSLKSVSYFIGPRLKTTWAYLQIRTFSIRSIIACAAWNQ